MKKFISFFIGFVLIMYSLDLKADAQSTAVGTAVVVGSVFAITSVVDEALSPSEFQNFTDVTTNSTSQLNHFNGLNIETKVYDVVPGVYLMIFIQNTSGSPAYFETTKTKIVFPNGMVRYPDQNQVGNILLQDQQTTILTIRAPKKSDFNSQDFFHLQIPLKVGKVDHTYQVTYKNNPKIKEVEKSRFDATYFNVGFEYGGSFFGGQQANQTENKSAGAFGMFIDFFGSEKHGLILGLKSVDYKPNDQTKAYYGIGGERKYDSIMNAFVGYTNRKYFSDKYYITSSLLLGNTRLKYQDAALNDEASEIHLGLRFEWNSIFAKYESGPWQGTYSWYLGADYFHVPTTFKNSFGDLTGGNGTAFIGIKIGM